LTVCPLVSSLPLEGAGSWPLLTVKAHSLVACVHHHSMYGQVISSEVGNAVVEAVAGPPNGGSYETKNYTVLCPKPGTPNVRHYACVFQSTCTHTLQFIHLNFAFPA